MAGRGGSATVTTKNLKVMIVDTERQVIGVSGAVAGHARALFL